MMKLGSKRRSKDLFACKLGWASCDRSLLTPTEEAEVVAAQHARNLSSCRNRQSEAASLPTDTR